MGKSIIKRLVNIITPNRLKLFYQHSLHEKYKEMIAMGTISYSQEGEDLILKKIFEGKTKGFYIDVGAHHPKKFSNTYLFYKQGWKGINIDVTPEIISLFIQERPNDINLAYGISDEPEEMTYYMFNEPALNTFSEELAMNRDGLLGAKILAKRKVELKRLDYILDKFLKKGQEIDFLTIDVEGYDLKVLKSNNWKKYTPKVVLVESIGTQLENQDSSEIIAFMKSQGYYFFAKAINTLFFRLNANLNDS